MSLVSAMGIGRKVWDYTVPCPGTEGMVGPPHWLGVVVVGLFSFPPAYNNDYIVGRPVGWRRVWLPGYDKPFPMPVVDGSGFEVLERNPAGRPSILRYCGRRGDVIMVVNTILGKRGLITWGEVGEAVEFLEEIDEFTGKIVKVVEVRKQPTYMVSNLVPFYTRSDTFFMRRDPELRELASRLGVAIAKRPPYSMIQAFTLVMIYEGRIPTEAREEVRLGTVEEAIRLDQIPS